MTRVTSELLQLHQVIKQGKSFFRYTGKLGDMVISQSTERKTKAESRGREDTIAAIS